MWRVNEKQAEWQRPHIINEPIFTIFFQNPLLKIFLNFKKILIFVKISCNKFAAVVHFEFCHWKVGIVVRRQE